MKAFVVYHAGYVKIEYQHLNSRTRRSTGVALTNKQELKSNGSVRTTVKDSTLKQQKIDSCLSKAEKILKDHLYKFSVQPTGEQFSRAWDEFDKQVKDSKKLMDYYLKFYATKQIEFNRKGFSKKSIKDYLNIKFYLEDFITYSKSEIYIEEINREWMNRFVVFNETKRQDYDKPRKRGGKYWTKGGLIGSTIKKRMGLVIGFFHWMADERYFEFPKGLATYYRTLPGSEAIKAIVNKEEVNKLYLYDFKNEKSNYVKDIFVLSCFTGMRWYDMYSFNFRYIFDVPTVGLMIEKAAEKTKEIFRVPLNKITIEIMRKYNYTFNKYENANFNKTLKLLLKDTGWFNDDTKFLNSTGNYLKRWECISIHRGRDSFCTMLVNMRVPVSEILKYTGHKSISTLNKYIDTKAQIVNYTNELVTE